MKLEDNMAIDKKTGKTYESSKQAIMKWQKSNLTQIKFNLNNEADADIIEYLDSCPNKQGLIKDLLRQHIAKEKATD